MGGEIRTNLSAEEQVRLQRELHMQDVLIKGYQKENEKLTDDSKGLRKEIEDLRSLLHAETKKVTDLRHRVIRETGQVLLAEQELDIETMNELGIKNAVPEKVFRDLREQKDRLERDAKDRDETLVIKEIRFKKEIEKVREEKL